jgi:YD repeat-containing protein
MKKIHFLFGLLFFIACKKESDTIPPSIHRKFDSVQYQCGTLTIFKTVYDGEKLVSLIGQGSSLRNYYFIYNSGGQLVQRDLETSTGSQKLTEYKYNGAGQLIEKKDLLPVCGSASEYYKYTFTYTNGKLTESTAYLKDNTLPDYVFHTRRVYTWTGENITSVTAYDDNNVPYPQTLSFAYDLTKPNPFQIFKDLWLQDIYEPPSTTFFFLSKNLLTKWVFGPSIDCVANYTFDNVFNESRIKSLSLACLGQLWSFTYTQ